jgi:peptide deformylase
MSGLKIIRLGHPALRVRSKAVTKRELRTKRFQKFLDNLAAICIKNQGAGIAAPQVGVNKRVIVVFVDPKNPRYPDRPLFPLTVVINPKVTKHAKVKKEDWEGDLSVDLRALVPRFASCTVTGWDRKGKEVLYVLKNDFHARVFQHEIDHLDGIFFLDKVKNKKTISEIKEWKKYLKGKKVD